MELNETYWTERYLNGQTAWDIGYASPAIIEYFKQLNDKTVRILIPGGGNGHEVAALWELGFQNVFLLDISKSPLDNFHKLHPQFPQVQLVQSDFFKYEDTFDYIVEQTFFCALDPSLRNDYVKHSAHLLKTGGKLVGLLFNIALNDHQPPFGGHSEIYRPLFEKHFHVQQMEKCQNSIAARKGNELFIEMSPLKVQD